MSVWSYEPETMVLPSGEKDTEFTESLCAPCFPALSPRDAAASTEALRYGLRVGGCQCRRTCIGIQVCRHWHPPTLSPYLSAPTLAAASLELKAEKESAHSGYVRSVAFSPDGKTIVSGSDDQTLKVWDAGAWALIPLNPHAQN